jgi:hypothetical protein
MRIERIQPEYWNADGTASQNNALIVETADEAPIANDLPGEPSGNQNEAAVNRKVLEEQVIPF